MAIEDVTNQQGVPPGPEGWGIPNKPKRAWLREEASTLDLLSQLVPQKVHRQSAKEPNNELLAKIDEIQKENGIDSGFCFLYLAEAIFKKQLDWKRQLIGSCVASGDVRTTAYRMLAEVFLFNEPEELPGIDIDGRDCLAFYGPFNYRAGRREAGINGRSDGSLCIPHIKGKMKYGHVPCSTELLESDAFPEPQSTRLYKDWGAANPGNSLMAKHDSVAKKYLLLESEPVKDIQDSRDLIVDHKKPLNICSSWAFVPDYKHRSWKDANGDPVWIWKKSGVWQHNMSVIGFVAVGSDEFVIIENSWADYHKGRKWFAIPASLFQTWLRSATVQSVGNIDMSDNASPWPDEPAN